MDKKDLPRCEEMTLKNTRCKHNVFIDNLCTLHYNRRMQKEKAPLLTHNGETKECTSIIHKRSDSRYPKEKVPVEKFYKPNKPKNDLYKTCIDCRNYKKNRKNTFKKKHDEQLKSNPDYGACCSSQHDSPGISNFPRFKVPITMFEKKGEDKSYFCSDCREYEKKMTQAKRKKKKEQVEDGKNFFCAKCHKIVDIENRATNVFGSPSSACIDCKIIEKVTNKKKYEKKKNLLRSIRIEKIKECGCSCRMCKSIFLKPEEGTLFQVKLTTYEIDGIRYVDYEGETYITSVFIEKFEPLLELITIDLDHLSEVEQRERGIIGPDEPYLEKRGRVSDMNDEESIRNEAKKTQILCCKCHIIVTMSREKQYGAYTHNYIKKENYIQELKRQGCEICGFFEEDIFRYFEFDHINTEDKVAIISDILRKKDYTMEDLIEECKKCRILCRPCHRLHTERQRKEGLFD